VNDRSTDPSLGAFILIYGIYSAKIKQSLYLGEALPATVVGIILGPISAKLYEPEQWGAAAKDQQHYITLVSSSIAHRPRIEYL
jgi:sodium/hydrogen antiporter